MLGIRLGLEYITTCQFGSCQQTYQFVISCCYVIYIYIYSDSRVYCSLNMNVNSETREKKVIIKNNKFTYYHKRC